jgi:hypothetical protein
MGEEHTKIKKLRTFYDDIEKARASEPVNLESKTTTHKKVDVIDEPKKERSITPIKKPVDTNIKVINFTAKTLTATPKPETQPAPKPKPELTKDTIQPAKTEVPNVPTHFIDVSDIKNVDRDSLLSGHGAIFSTLEEDNEITEGNIITDQKRKRFRLLPAMGMALRDWYNKKSLTVSEMINRQPEGEKINSSDSRAEIIKSAAKTSALAPSDDYRTVAKRITEQPRTNITPTTLVIKKPSEVEAPSWNYVESESNLKTTPSQQPEKKVAPSEVNVDFRAQPVITEAEPEFNWPTSDTIEPTIETPVINQEPVEFFPKPKVLEAVVETNDTPATLAEFTKPEYLQPIIKNQTPVTQKRVVPYRPVVDERTLPNWRFAVVSLIGIMFGISFTLWIFDFGNTDNNQTIVVEKEFTKLINADEEIEISLGDSAITLWGNVRAIETRPTTNLAIAYPMVTIAGETQPATVAEILATLNLKAPGTFIRSITDINLGLNKNKEPFIVLKVTSFDSAFGGLLEWESSMSADLSPLFGAPVLGTFDPLARTATQIREPYFIDRVVDNLDLRILNDETQKERIAYAFIDRNTIIITTSKSTLTDLVNLMR